MTEYVQQLGRHLADTIENTKDEFQEPLTAFVEELDRLDPRDLLPVARFGFVISRIALRSAAQRYSKYHSQGTGRNIFSYDAQRRLVERCREITESLASYTGEGSRAETRTFPFLADLQLRDIVERDYKELSLRILPSGAWKSAVVLSGSILEAILTDVLLSDPATAKRAKDARAAQAKQQGKRLQREWTLEQLIEVAEALSILSSDRARTVDQVLRDYRNFVHPRREVRAGHSCDEAEALLAKGGLDSVCNHLGSAAMS